MIGPWWPGPSTILRDAAHHWASWSTQKQELAQTLRNQRKLLSQNQGKTAEDLISRFFQGEKSELDKAEKYKTKADALNSAADAIDYLRSRLTEIANEGNKEIDDVLASKKPLPEQLTEIQAIQARCNADAAKASVAAIDKIMAATQKILDAEGIHGDARTWARSTALIPTMSPPPARSARMTWIRRKRSVVGAGPVVAAAARVFKAVTPPPPAAAGAPADLAVVGSGGFPSGSSPAPAVGVGIGGPGSGETCASRSNSHAYRKSVGARHRRTNRTFRLGSA